MTDFSGGGYTGEGYHSALNQPKAEFGSYHAAHTAGKKALAELLEQIQQEEDKAGD